MRLAVAYIAQETNTFNPELAEIDDFEAFGLYQGAEMLDKLAGVGPVGGFLDAVAASGRAVDIVPLLKAQSVAGGRIDDGTLALFTTELADRLRAAPSLDGIALLLHGGCASESEDDVEGHLLTAARAIVGPDVPIVVGLDHHANVTQRMVEQSTAIIGHRTQPHDQYDTGRLSGELLIRIAAGEATPVMAWRKLRLMSHQEQYLTSRGPMRVWFERARALESVPGVLSVSTFPMQPWLDVAEGGWAAVVVTDGDRSLAERHADELADLAWEMRTEFQLTTAMAPGEAVRAAAAGRGLVLLSDTGDSVLGGAGGDSTVLLKELLGSPQVTALVPLVDPAAARQLSLAGVGARVDLEVGGAVTGWFDSLALAVTVTAIHRPVLRDLAGYPEAEIHLGETAVAQAGNVTVVITERPGVGGVHPGMYEHLGISPLDYDVAVLKTASNFQFFADLTTQVVRANTFGPTQSDLASMVWTHVPRPIYPLDPVPDWRGAR